MFGDMEEYFSTCSWMNDIMMNDGGDLLEGIWDNYCRQQ
jgi:hypothetical protein